MKISKRTIFVLGLVIFMFFSQAGISLAQPADIQGHWAEKQIIKWVDKGLVKGYQNGMFKSDANITRAEFMALVNRAFGFTGGTKSNFSDVEQKDWFAADVARAAAAGYISGYKDGTVRPNNNISRQEAAIILARILKLDTSAGKSAADKFKDAKDIPSWSEEDVDAVVDRGLMNGYPDHTFKPEGYITRAEVVVILDRAISISPKTTSYDRPGTYGPQSGMNVVEGNVNISAAGVNLANTKITGDLVLTENIGKGTVTLKNVTVQGSTIVHGGGPNSVVMVNFNGKTVEVDVPDSFNVRLVASGNTSIDNVVMKSGGKLEESGLTGSGFATVTVSKDAQVVLVGDFDTVNVETGNAIVNMESGKITNLNIAKNAAGTGINLSSGSNIGTLAVNAAATIKGQGRITTANINANGVSIQQNPANTNVSSGFTANIAGRQQTGNTSGNGSSGSSGGGGGGGIYSTATTPGTLTVTPVSADNGTTGNLMLVYTLGEDFNQGSVEFTLPAEILAAAGDLVDIFRGQSTEEIQTNVGEEGRKVYATGITANAGDTVVLTLAGKTIPAAGSYVFIASADADGEAAYKTATAGTGSESVTFEATSVSTIPGKLEIDPVSANNGEVKNITLTYNLGENFTHGSVEFELPEGIKAIENSDTVTMPGLQTVPLVNYEGNESADAVILYEGTCVSVTGVYAAAGEKVVLHLNAKTIPATGDYTFKSTSDADGANGLAGANKSGTGGTAAETVTFISNPTAPGQLSVSPADADTGTTQTITLAYSLGEDFNIGSVEFRLPVDITAVADQDTITINGPVEAGLESEQIGNGGRNVYITGITASQGDIVKLTLTGKKIPAPGLYTFNVIADADGEAANKAATLGTGSETANFMVTEPTVAGTLSIDPMSADTGTTQTFKLTYALGENFTEGRLEFSLPAGIPVDEKDMVALPGESNIQIGVVDQVYKVYVTGITAEANRTVILTLFNKKVPVPGSYTFSVIADADGEATFKSETTGTGSEAESFSSNSVGTETGTQEGLIRNFVQAINDKDANKAKNLLSQDVCYVEKYSDGSQIEIDTSDGIKNYIDKIIYNETKLTIDNIQQLDTTTLVVYGTGSSYVTETVGITDGIRYTMKYTSKEGKISYLEFQQNSEDEKLLYEKTEGIIGVYLEDDNGTLKIKDCEPGLPAEKAGLLKGDIIEAVDGIKITDMKYGVKEAICRISGVVGTKVKLTVNRDGTIFDKEIERVEYSY